MIMRLANLLQYATRTCLGPWVRKAFQMRSQWQAPIPMDGPAVFVANHASYLDPIFLAAVLPRPIRFFVLSDIYSLWWCRWLLALYGTIPVRGEATRLAMTLGRELLHEGHWIGLFPEGQRSFDGVVGKGKPGALFLAIQTGVPLIPVGIRGAYEAYPRWTKWPRLRPIRISFGRPRFYEGFSASSRPWLDHETETLMEEIRCLTEQGATF